VLITTKNFTINSFLKLPDALAVIDLAEACEIFQQIGNYRATGVCYNNIANYQAKNGKFDLAIQNYDHAIE
jgi:glutaminase